MTTKDNAAAAVKNSNTPVWILELLAKDLNRVPGYEGTFSLKSRRD